MTYRCAHMRSTRSASNALVRAGQLDRPSARPPRDAASEGPWPPDTTSSPSPTAPPSSCPRASPGPAYRRADQQHELPAHVTVLADAVRLRDLGEREGLRDREREAPGLDQLADLGEHVDRAAGVPAAEPHPVLLRATEVGYRHDVLRATREVDELGQDAAPGDVERDVDAAGSERANPPGQALAVGDGLGAQRAQVVVVGGT